MSRNGDEIPENRLDEADLRARLPGVDVRVYESLGSTNDQAKRLVAQGLIRAPGLVIARQQTAGRGRRRNTWWSAHGALTCSFVIGAAHPGAGATDQNAESSLRLGGFAAALAIREVVSRAVGFEAHLKWPNDVMLRGRKVAGILCEAVGDRLVVGLGLNVNNAIASAPQELADSAVSLCDVAGRLVSLADLAVALAPRLVDWMAQTGAGTDWSDQFDRHHLLRGRELVVQTGDRNRRGRCVGIDQSGAMLLSTSGELLRIHSGHVVEWH